jgi:chromosome segregation ATPase
LQTRVDALEQLRHDVALLEEELNDANARTARTAEQLSASEKERTRQKAELKGVNKQLDELWAIRKERDGLRTDYKGLSTRVEELERTQRDLIEERTLLQSQLQEARLTVEEITNERNQHALTARANEDKVRELGQVQDALEEKIELLRAEKKSLQVQLTHLERENARLVDQRQFFESELTVLRNQNRTAETALASVKKAFSEVRVALGETKSRVRRRTLDTWPRVGSTLRGVSPEASNLNDVADGQPQDAEAVGAGSAGKANQSGFQAASDSM